MPQSWNPAAVRVAARVLFRQPALAVPHLEVRDVGCLDFAALRAAGCEAVIFDKDNTLTSPYAAEVHPRAAAAVRRCVDAFGAGRAAVLSNSAGTPDDPGYRQADALERSLGLPVLRRREKKPRGFESVRAHFGCDPAALVVIGDRYLTDVVFGNLHGTLTVRTEQLTSAGDNRVARVMGILERWLLAVLRWRGVRAPPHRLRADAARFVCEPSGG